jgi:hypothetical protein
LKVLFAHGDPKIYFGGDSVAFWGPLSWTIVFGLGFATFITLIILPVMYLKGWHRRQNRPTYTRGAPESLRYPGRMSSGRQTKVDLLPPGTDWAPARLAQ